MTWLRKFLQALRFSNAVLPSIAVLVAFGVSRDTIPATLAVASVGLMVCLHSLITIWNDIEDMQVDAVNNRHAMTELRKSKGYERLKFSLILIGVLAVAMCLILPLASSVLAVGTLFVGWLYNSRPFMGSRRPVASMVLLALGYGLLPFLFGTVGGKWSWSLVMLAIGWTLARTSLSILKDYKDAVGDSKMNKRTFLLVYGARRTALTSVCLAVGGLALSLIAVWFYGATWQIYIALVGIAAWLLYERVKLLPQDSYRELNVTFHACLKYQIIFDGAVLLWALQS